MHKFDKLDRERFEIEVYKNIPIQKLIDILTKVDFILTDVSINKEFDLENITMSGCIPMAFSILTPLIISLQTNHYYRFKNVIEFDKFTHSPIPLYSIDPHNIREECDQIVSKNTDVLDNLFEQIFIAPSSLVLESY
jgi:hypothetical protein